MNPVVHHPLREAPYLKHMRLPYVAFVEGVLGDDECAALIARIEASSPELAPIMVGGRPVMDTNVRNNERVIFDDPVLAELLFEKTRAICPATLHRGALIGYNERFRGYRYRRGQRFAPHFDGAYFRPGGVREGSQLSLLFYLNSDFSGGETRLLDYEVVIQPRMGSVLAFEHAMLHEGSEVRSGTKYVLRTDAMYRF